MKCHKCGNDNKDGYRFCSRCGSKLQGITQMSADDFGAQMLKMSAAINDFKKEKVVHVDVPDDFENEETVILSQSENDVLDFENEETVILSQSENDVPDFENEETVILSEAKYDVSDYENEETVVLENEETLETEGTIILQEVSENEKTVILDECSGDKTVQVTDKIETPPTAPSFDYRSVYKEYRTGDDETAYIDHLRRLKELLDDGIITEDEFTRKKQQILGL